MYYLYQNRGNVPSIGDHHGYDTRHRQKNFLRKPKHEIYKRSLTYFGVKFLMFCPIPLMPMNIFLSWISLNIHKHAKQLLNGNSFYLLFQF